MKSLFSIIRWKFVIPVAILIAAIVVFFVIFFDPLLARGIEKVGSRVNGAKVEVGGLKTKFMAGRISINRLQVADKDQPMKNIVEAGPLAFQMDFMQAVSKRFIINDATLKGLQFDTPRKTSGALPKRIERKIEKNEEPGIATKLMDKYSNQFKVNVDGIRADAKAKIEFDPDKLSLVTESKQLKERSTALPNEWETNVNNLQVEERLKKIEADLNSIKNTQVKGPEAITAIPEALKKLQAAKDDLQKLKTEVQQTKDGFFTDVKEIKAGVVGLKDAKKRDVDDLMSRFNLDFADPERLVQGFIGPTVLNRFRTVLHYVQVARKHMPSKIEKESLPPKPRADGMDIEFPTPAAPPKFWLMKSELGGVFNGIEGSGLMTDLTSDPSRVGKPFRLNLDGKKETQRFGATAVLDHTTDVNKDAFTLSAQGFDLVDMVGADGPMKALTTGKGSAELALNLIGTSGIGGNLRLYMSGLKFDNASLLSMLGVDAAATSTEETLKRDFISSVAKSIETTPQIVVDAQLFGTWQDPGMKINSNLVGVLANTIKSTVGNLVQKQKAELEARLDTIMKEQQRQIESTLAQAQEKANAQIKEFEAKIQNEINKATGINLAPGGEGSPIPGIKVPSLDKLFKK